MICALYSHIYNLYHRVCHQILQFLSTSIITTEDMLMELLEKDSLWLSACLLMISEKGYVRAYTFPLLGREVRLWGITAKGQVFVAPDCYSINHRTSSARLFSSHFSHRLGLQNLHIRAERLGWLWKYNNTAPSVDQERPDAFISYQSSSIAVEYERTKKSRDQYFSILVDRLISIREGEYECIVWVCEDEKMMCWLESVLFQTHCITTVKGPLFVRQEVVRRVVSTCSKRTWENFLLEQKIK